MDARKSHGERRGRNGRSPSGDGERLSLKFAKVSPLEIGRKNPLLSTEKVEAALKLRTTT